MTAAGGGEGDPAGSGGAVAPTGAGDRTASDAARRARKAAHGDPVGAPGLAEAVLAARWYRNAGAADPGPEAGVLMLKPGIVPSAAALGELAERVAECGYRISQARLVEHDEVRRLGLLRRHYHDHWAMATEGVLQPDERATLARRYEAAGFTARFGRPADGVPVVPALVLAERLGIDAGRVGRWAEAAAQMYGIDSGALLGCNEVGDLADVQLLVDAREFGADARAEAVPGPVFVLDPQLPLLASWWEDGPDPTFVAVIHAASAQPLPYARMRRDFLGTGAPSNWPPGSLRGDILHGVSALRYRPGIEAGAARNGVHLSNGAVEAMRETVVWFGVEPDATALGAALRSAGCDPVEVLDAVLVEEPGGGGRAGRLRPIAEVTAHLGVTEAVDRLRGRRLFGADGRSGELRSVQS